MAGSPTEFGQKRKNLVKKKVSKVEVEFVKIFLKPFTFTGQQ